MDAVPGLVILARPQDHWDGRMSRAFRGTGPRFTMLSVPKALKAWSPVNQPSVASLFHSKRWV